MNIFILDKDKTLSAQYHCDAHIGKMILESAQLLCMAHHYFDSPFKENTPYKSSLGQRNHPCAKWVRESINNYNWLCDFALELSKEYQKRLNKIHKSNEIVIWSLNNLPILPNIDQTPFVLAMDDKYKVKNGEDFDIVESYRNYYIESKFIERDIIDYKYSQIPNWFQMSLAKRALELPKNSELRNRVEEFLSGKVYVKKVNLDVRKNSIVKINNNELFWKVTKYPSNKEIELTQAFERKDESEKVDYFVNSYSEIKIISKEDIIEIIL